MVDISNRSGRRLVPIPVEQVAIAAELTERLGPYRAALELRLGRAALLTVVGTGKASAGTAALLREAMARRGVQA
ncbi:MAG: hypothetical protein ABI488_23590 [Polyangiaceae bacterium]